MILPNDFGNRSSRLALNNPSMYQIRKQDCASGFSSAVWELAWRSWGFSVFKVQSSTCGNARLWFQAADVKRGYCVLLIWGEPSDSAVVNPGKQRTWWYWKSLKRNAPENVTANRAFSTPAEGCLFLFWAWLWLRWLFWNCLCFTRTRSLWRCQ